MSPTLSGRPEFPGSVLGCLFSPSRCQRGVSHQTGWYITVFFSCQREGISIRRNLSRSGEIFSFRIARLNFSRRRACSRFFLRFAARTAILGNGKKWEQIMPDFDPLTTRYSSRRSMVCAGIVLRPFPRAQVGLDVRKWRRPARRRYRHRHGWRDAAARADGAALGQTLSRSCGSEKALRQTRRLRCAGNEARTRFAQRLPRVPRKVAPHGGPGRAHQAVAAQPRFGTSRSRALRPAISYAENGWQTPVNRQTLGARQRAHLARSWRRTRPL